MKPDRSQFYKGSVFKHTEAITWLGYNVQEVEVTPTLKAWMHDLGLPGIGLLATTDKDKTQTVTYSNQSVAASTLLAAQRNQLSIGSTLIRWDGKLRKWVSHYIMIDIDNEFNHETGVELLNYIKTQYNINAFLYETPSSRMRLAIYSSEPLSTYKAVDYAQILKSTLIKKFPDLAIDRIFPADPKYKKASCVFLFRDRIYSCQNSTLIPININYNEKPNIFFSNHDLNNTLNNFKILSSYILKEKVHTFPRKIRRQKTKEIYHKINQLISELSLDNNSLDPQEYKKALNFWKLYESNYTVGQRNNIAKAIFAKGLKKGLDGEALIQAFIEIFGTIDEELDKRVADLRRTYDRYKQAKPISTSYFLKGKKLIPDQAYTQRLCSRAQKDAQQHLKILLEFLLYRSNSYNVIYFGLDTIRKLLGVSQDHAQQLRTKLVELRFIKLIRGYTYVEGRRFANEYILNWYVILDIEDIAEDPNSNHLSSISSYQGCSVIVGGIDVDNVDFPSQVCPARSFPGISPP